MNNLFKFSEKRGFTLAEVLITLTILGVVASITMPSTIHRVEKNHFITKYRKTYAALNSAYDQWNIETNYSHPHLGGNNIESMAPMLSRYLKTRRRADYSIYDKPYNGKGIKNLDGTSSFVGGQGTVYLNDGTDINIAAGHPHLVCEDPNCPNWTGDYSAAFFIDVNGRTKGPNTIGRDIFILIGLHDGLYTWPLPERFQKQQPFYRDFNEQVRTNSYWSRCTKNSSGFACSSWFLNHSDYDK